MCFNLTISFGGTQILAGNKTITQPIGSKLASLKSRRFSELSLGLNNIALNKSLREYNRVVFFFMSNSDDSS